MANTGSPIDRKSAKKKKKNKTKKKKEQQKKRHVFNLLKPVEVSLTAWDKIYDWILNRARIVIIVAEALIVVAFFIKFVVDQQAKNKEQTFEELKAEEAKYQDDGRELLYRSLQDRNRNYRLLWNSSTNSQEILSELYSYVSNTVEDLEVSVSKDSITVSGFDNTSAIRALESSVKNSSTFENAKVELSQENEDINNRQGRYTLTAEIVEDRRTREDIELQTTQ